MLLFVFLHKCSQMYSNLLPLSILSCCVVRSIRPSQPYQSACHQHNNGRGRPAKSSCQLDFARRAWYSHTSLQSVLELDRTHQVDGAIQEEKEKDHQWGNAATLSMCCPVLFLAFLFISVFDSTGSSMIISASFPPASPPHLFRYPY